MISQADLFNLSVNNCYITEEQQDHLPHCRSSWDAATNDLDRLTATPALQFPCNGLIPAETDTSTQQEVTFTPVTVTRRHRCLSSVQLDCLLTIENLLAFVTPIVMIHGLP